MGAQIIEGIYGSSTGPGPHHLLIEGDAGRETLCGVKRVDIYRGPVDLRTCTRCLDRARSTSLSPRLDPSLVEPALDGVAEALADMATARARLSAHMESLRGVQGKRLDGYLKLANDGGVTMAELGQMLGLTRARIQQRVAALDSAEVSE
jgi:hypothetical protein